MATLGQVGLPRDRPVTVGYQWLAGRSGGEWRGPARSIRATGHYRTRLFPLPDNCQQSCKKHRSQNDHESRCCNGRADIFTDT